MERYDNKAAHSKKKQEETGLVKKAIIFLAVIIAVSLMLSGCKGMGDSTKPNDKRFVSAVGFDESEGEVTALVLVVEAVGEGKVNPYITRQAHALSKVLL